MRAERGQYAAGGVVGHQTTVRRADVRSQAPDARVGQRAGGRRDSAVRQGIGAERGWICVRQGVARNAQRPRWQVGDEDNAASLAIIWVRLQLVDFETTCAIIALKHVLEDKNGSTIRFKASLAGG